MKTSLHFQKALEYAVHGYAVLPLQSGKKIPLLKSWKKYQTTPATDEEINEWWEKNPSANIGIITGKISGITVVDIDTKGDKVVPLETFPPTYTVKTPSGGYHLYYEYDPRILQTANTFPQFPHVDIRNDGGYVVAPPSKNEKGDYVIFKNLPVAAFPVSLFLGSEGKTPSKKRTALKLKIGVEVGGQENAMTSIIGKLVRSYREKDWEKEVWEAACAINETYKPPIKERDMQRIYESITKTERARLAGLIPSPIEMTDEQKEHMSKTTRNKRYALTVNDDGIPHGNSSNIVRMLENDPALKDKVRYDVFRRVVQVKGDTEWRPYTDEETVKVMVYLQDEYNRGITKLNVHDAIVHVAYGHQFDEPTEWLKSLEWDEEKRLEDWLIKTCGVPDDQYHRAVGSRWFLGLVARLVYPGCIFDNALVFYGPQNIGKTSILRIIGGEWYRSFTGNVADKDFLQLLNGAAIIDLDEGAALSKADSMRVKATISRTEDTYRAPYDRTPKTYHRRNVFAMTTNDHDVLRDPTGNRRFWMINFTKLANFAWLEENRDQIFAEAYFVLMNKISLPEVPLQEAQDRQAEATALDPWEDVINSYISDKAEYSYNPELMKITTKEIYMEALQGNSMSNIKDGDAKRIGGVLRRMGFDRKQRREGSKREWFFVASDELIAEIKSHIKEEKKEKVVANEKNIGTKEDLFDDDEKHF